MNYLTTDNICFYLQNRPIQTSQAEVNGTVILPPLVFPGWAGYWPLSPPLSRVLKYKEKRPYWVIAILPISGFKFKFKNTKIKFQEKSLKSSNGCWVWLRLKIECFRAQNAVWLQNASGLISFSTFIQNDWNHCPNLLKHKLVLLS